MKKLKAIILAAGKGTRMKSDIPKVLHKVCGKTILQYVLDAVRAAGCLRSYVVIGHQAGQIEAILDKDSVPVLQKKLLGTADAVRCVLPHIKNDRGSVLILCGDAPLVDKSVIRQLVRHHKKTDAACTFLTAVVHDPFGYGRIIRDLQGRVVAIREEKDAEGLEKNIAEINVGVYCIKARELAEGLKTIKLNPTKKEYYLTDIVELFYEKKLKIETVETEDATQGIGINTKEDLAFAEGVIRKQILKRLMQDGVTIRDPQTTYIDAGVKIGRDTIIQPFTFIEENVRIGARCQIGPFARLRPGTRLADDVIIGNFTEVSRSKIGSKTIIKHFSFLGDATLGQDVNVGAGVVTANYDGKNKNRTVVADGAFIGSDAILVAPTKLGKKSVVGAGSVLTKNKRVPDGGVAVGVPARVIKK